jgi:hypothetical protein
MPFLGPEIIKHRNEKHLTGLRPFRAQRRMILQSNEPMALKAALLAHAPLACPLLHAPCAPLPCLIATQHHARRGAAPPACQHYHAGPCSWRSALALPAL